MGSSQGLGPQTLDQALALASQGLPCFPCADDKRPACPGGFKAATNDYAALNQLWGRYSGSLIGVPTGAVSGIDVLDIDPRHGGDVWLKDVQNNLPHTRIHQTRSTGWHLLFRHQAGLRNSAGKVAPGVDVRADGGYIIWWPALGFPVYNGEFFEAWPFWLLEQLNDRSSARVPPQKPLREVSSAYIQSALNNAALNVARAQPGLRNETLNRELFAVSRFIESGDLDPSVIAQTLAGAALEAGLDKNEIVATIASALRARGVR